MDNLYQWFQFTNEPLFKASINTNMVFYQHLHLQFEFIYVIEGELIIKIENKELTLCKNDICLIPSNIVHSYDSKTHNRVFIMIFDPKLFPDFNKMFKNKKMTKYNFNVDNQSDIFDNCFINILKLCDSSNKILLYGYAYIILGEIVNVLELVDDDSVEKSSLQKVLEYIKNNYENDISLNSVSKEIGISKFYISKMINDKVGCSFNHYLNTIRIDKAIKLLDDDKDIIEVSYEVGFNSPRTFYRIFREIVNTTPLKYKKRTT